LGNWISGSYGIPEEQSEESEDEGSNPREDLTKE